MGFKKDAIIKVNTPYLWDKPDHRRFLLAEEIKHMSWHRNGKHWK